MHRDSRLGSSAVLIPQNIQRRCFTEPVSRHRCTEEDEQKPGVRKSPVLKLISKQFSPKHKRKEGARRQFQEQRISFRSENIFQALFLCHNRRRILINPAENAEAPPSVDQLPSRRSAVLCIIQRVRSRCRIHLASSREHLHTVADILRLSLLKDESAGPPAEMPPPERHIMEILRKRVAFDISEVLSNRLPCLIPPFHKTAPLRSFKSVLSSIDISNLSILSILDIVKENRRTFFHFMPYYFCHASDRSSSYRKSPVFLSPDFSLHHFVFCSVLSVSENSFISLSISTGLPSFFRKQCVVVPYALSTPPSDRL